MIDLLNIQPHQISRDLQEKIVFIHGDPKSGKTTTASQFPQSLLLAFEKGYNALSGVMAQNVTKWSDFKKILKQLEKPEVKEKFRTIVVDTVDLAYDACEKFIIQREGVEKIGDIPYGAGYGMVKKEFNEALRSIPMLGYGLVKISHAQIATFTSEDGTEFTKTVPTLAKQPRHIALSMADVIGYAKSVEKEDGMETLLYLRGTQQFEAGSRFKHTPAVIKFEYSALVDAIATAIEKEEAEKGQSQVVDSNRNAIEIKEPTFDEYKAEIKAHTAKLVEKLGKEEAGATLKSIVEKHLGKGRTLKEATADHAEQLSLIAYDLEEAAQ